MGQKGDQIRRDLSTLAPDSQRAAAAHLGAEKRRQRDEALAAQNMKETNARNAASTAAVVALGTIIVLSAIVVVVCYVLTRGRPIEEHRERVRKQLDSLLP